MPKNVWGNSGSATHLLQHWIRTAWEGPTPSSARPAKESATADCAFSEASWVREIVPLTQYGGIFWHKLIVLQDLLGCYGCWCYCRSCSCCCCCCLASHRGGMQHVIQNWSGFETHSWKANSHAGCHCKGDSRFQCSRRLWNNSFLIYQSVHTPVEQKLYIISDGTFKTQPQIAADHLPPPLRFVRPLWPNQWDFQRVVELLLQCVPQEVGDIPVWWVGETSWHKMGWWAPKKTQTNEHGNPQKEKNEYCCWWKKPCTSW